MQISISFCRTSDHYLSVIPAIFKGRFFRNKKMYHLHFPKFLEGKQIMAVDEMQQKSHCVSPPETTQTCSLGRRQKKSVEHNDCLYVASLLLKSHKTPNGQCLQSAKLLSNKLVKCYSNAFKRHWNNTGTICLNIILQTWDLFLHTGLTEHYIFFMTRSTTFFSSTVFVISRFSIPNREAILKVDLENKMVTQL